MADLIKKTGDSGFEPIDDAGKSQDVFFPMSPNLCSAQLGLKNKFTITHPFIEPIKSELIKTYPDLLSIEEGVIINPYLNIDLTENETIYLYGLLVFINEKRHINIHIEKQIQHAHDNNQDFFTFSFSKKAILNLLSIKNDKYARRQLKDHLMSLNDKYFFIQKDNGSFFYTRLISSVDFDMGTDALRLSISLRLVPPETRGKNLIYPSLTHYLNLLKKCPKHSKKIIYIRMLHYVESQQKQKENKIGLEKLAGFCCLYKYLENSDYKKIQKLFDKGFELLKEIKVIQDWCSNTNKKGEVIYNFTNFDRDKKNNKIQQIPAIPCHEIEQAKGS